MKRKRQWANVLIHSKRSGFGDKGFEPRPAIASTDALPGTEDKINKMAARVLCGQELYHEEDRLVYDPELDD